MRTGVVGREVPSVAVEQRDAPLTGADRSALPRREIASGERVPLGILFKNSDAPVYGDFSSVGRRRSVCHGEVGSA